MDSVEKRVAEKLWFRIDEHGYAYAVKNWHTDNEAERQLFINKRLWYALVSAERRQAELTRCYTDVMDELGLSFDAMPEEAVKVIRERRQEWIKVTPESMPNNSHEVLVVAKLNDEKMRVTNRQHPYDVVSGWYVHQFPKLYVLWQPFPAPPEEVEP